MNYPLVIQQFAIERGHLYLSYPLKMLIFHGYVTLAEANYFMGFDQGTFMGFMQQTKPL